MSSFISIYTYDLPKHIIFPSHRQFPTINPENFKPTWLYIKRHTITGALYFGKTKMVNPIKYLGSGTYWNKHIKKYGKDYVETIWLKCFFFMEELVKFALDFSELNDIINSKLWKNMKAENGIDDWGGFTIRGHIWINDGTKEKYIKKTEDVPDGWVKGRYKGNENFKHMKGCRFYNNGKQTIRVYPENINLEEWQPGRVKPETPIITIWINNGEVSKLHPKNTPLPYGWELGRDPEWCKKPHKQYYAGKRYINDGLKNKMIPIDEPLPEGWIEGKTAYTQTPEYKKKISDSKKDRIWITDGETTKRIKKDAPIPDGFYEGLSDKYLDSIGTKKCNKYY